MGINKVKASEIEMASETTPIITERLMNALQEFSNRIPDIDVISVSSTEGFPLMGYSPTGQTLQDDELAIVSARVDTLSKSIQREIQRGDLEEAVVSTDEGFFAIAKAGTRGILIAIFKSAANRDFVIPQIKELANRVGMILEGEDVRWREIVRSMIHFNYIPSQLLHKFTAKVHETLMPAVAARIIYDTGAEFAHEITALLRDEINPKFPLDADEFTQFVSAIIDVISNGSSELKMYARTPTEFLTTIRRCVFCADIGQVAQCKFIEGIINGLSQETTGKNLNVKNEETNRRRYKEDDCEIFFVRR